MPTSMTLSVNLFVAPSMTMAETAYVSRSLRPKLVQVKRNRIVAFAIAATTVLAMTLASAAPAHADRRSNDALKAVAAIAAIALIAKAVKDKKHGHPRPQPVRSRLVPGVCAIEIGSGRGSVTGYAERCLRKEGFTYRLPGGCATDIRIYGRADRFYPEDCLRDAGFDTRDY
jgi:hypothetical protein